jgi:hypothetical protein
MEPGTRVGPYEITERIGAGGMGEVFRAHDARLDRDVAIKLLLEDASGDPGRMRRMEQEARAAGQLSHPNIVGVFDVGTHEGRTYVVTELLEGESLRDVVRRGPVPWRKAVELAVPVAEGLAAAHERGIVHRDVKPDNVFVTRDGRVKVLDFGVATWRGPDDGSPSAMARTMSQGGLLVGTVGYMSPEQARGAAVDHRCDVFAFGCLLYELLCGHEAFGGGTPMEILVAVQRDAPVPLLDRVDKLPVDLVRLVDRCLEKDPARRFQSMRDLRFALSLIQTTGGSLAERAPTLRTPAEPTPAPDLPVAPPPPRRGGRARAALLLALGMLVGAGAALGARRALVPPVEPPAFKQLTFGRGTVYTARFTLDGGGIVYSAAWGGKPRELFATVPGTRDSRSLGYAETDVSYLLNSGELSVIRRQTPGFSPGMLARMPLAGGPQKDLFDSISWADGSPDGARTVVVHRDKGRSLLEMPPGHVIAEASTLNYPRLSPDGTRVAFLEAAGTLDDAGRLVVVDAQGKRVLETAVWKSIEGVGWRSDGELWFTASMEGRALEMHAVDLQGRVRLLCRAPGRLVLHDIARDGRVIAERNSYRGSLTAGGAEGPERDISWLDFAELAQLSADGKQVLFSEHGDGAGAAITTYLRPVDGGPPLRLGDGLALALSPDGQRALLRIEEGGSHLGVVPVGPGRAAALPRGSLAGISWAAFTPDAARVVLLGNEPGQEHRLYLQDLAGGDPRPFTTEGVSVLGDALSPDGTLVAGRQGGKALLFPLDGGPARALPGLDAHHFPVGWTADGHTLFVRARRALPLAIDRYDLATGKVEPWRKLAPIDPAGVISIGQVRLARDGAVFVYESFRLLSDLYVIENLR